ncbi:MAG: hypothetical protein DKM50_09590 [Candidatus Margulisiibacteriota bacterium]|nr:MAG: hypothetical protein A2X43_00840 [Candidatus Margulisbacteria bacterium GWD2_39_127]OGI02377.1 MAG: hypothetical protein A2X42_09490 [Candidatus Margulisbacteria bacterium GWF2_38_17]OGI08510.1 MAG: hypothetical protein A2X41_07280 [Candidatus Margulisbacteria bacterium GWE2_39_32]PZM79021.1 MAG: hypothetical protein DKM50_09590 [Candidatus Margulisiibacteriota bacterium]HAR63419.1 hypothetical protein [Candidatus Margulisiibacteriota bacterium]
MLFRKFFAPIVTIIVVICLFSLPGHSNEKIENIQSSVMLIADNNDDQEISISTEIKSWFQPGFRVGAIAPGFGIIADLTTIPISISDVFTLFTRISYGFAQGDDQSSAVFYLNELLYYNNEGTPLSLYIGAGTNSPSKSEGNLGYNLILGLSIKTKLFNFDNEALLLETGVNNFSVSGFDKSVTNLLLGYKVLF